MLFWIIIEVTDSIIHLIFKFWQHKNATVVYYGKTPLRDREWVRPPTPGAIPAQWHIFDVTLQVSNVTTCCRCSGNTSSGSPWRAGTTACWSYSGGISTTCCATSTSSTIISPPYSRACALRPSGVVPQKTEVSCCITTPREKGKIHLKEYVHFRTKLFDSKCQSDLFSLIEMAFDK